MKSEAFYRDAVCYQALGKWEISVIEMCKYKKIDIQNIRQKHSLFNSDELASQYLVWSPLFLTADFSWSLGTVLQAFVGHSKLFFGSWLLFVWFSVRLHGFSNAEVQAPEANPSLIVLHCVFFSTQECFYSIASVFLRLKKWSAQCKMLSRWPCTAARFFLLVQFTQLKDAPHTMLKSFD